MAFKFLFRILIIVVHCLAGEKALRGKISFFLAILFSLYLLLACVILFLVIERRFETSLIYVWSPRAKEFAVLVVILVLASILSVTTATLRLKQAGALSLAGWMFYSPVLFAIIVPMHIIFVGVFAVFYLFWYPLTRSYLGYILVDGLLFPPNECIGLSLIAIGLAIYVASLYNLIYFTYKGEKLVKRSLYKYIRHPQYLGIILWTLGATILAGRAMCYIAWLTLTYVYLVLAEYEEKCLEENLGKRYIDYEKETYFMVPIPLPRLDWKRRILVYTVVYLSIVAILVLAVQMNLIALSISR